MCDIFYRELMMKDIDKYVNYYLIAYHWNKYTPPYYSIDVYTLIYDSYSYLIRMNAYFVFFYTFEKTIPQKGA